MEWGSILIGLLGIALTGIGVADLTKRTRLPRPERIWLLGLLALFPAWLLAFLSLLGRGTGPHLPKVVGMAWILSSATALLGVIATDTVLRHLHESGRPLHPFICWLLGIAALLPAWILALLLLSLTATR